MATASTKWYDNASRVRRNTEVFPMVSTVASVTTQSAYIVNVTLQRESLNTHRADMYETERFQISMTLPEARELVARLQEHIADLEYYATNAQWPRRP